jgi:hypothetical protein
MDQPHRQRIDRKFVIFAVVLVLVLWTFLGFGPLLWTSSRDERAAFGDMFGAVNALFAGLAFVGLIWAILLQRHELELQRDELSETRKELAGQKEQLARQASTMARQTFETTFFQLLRLHHDIVDGTRAVHGSRSVEGREAFHWLYRAYRGKQENTPGANLEIQGRLNAGYLAFFSEHENTVGHYFRNLYNIVKFVDKSEIENKKLYTNLLRAQLSAPELLLLFYNCLSVKGREKFKPLVEKYALLKTVPREQLVETSDVALFEQDAFSGS